MTHDLHGEAYAHMTGTLKHSPPRPAGQRRSAARYVIRRAQDAKDARLLLDVLGLDPQEAR